MTSLISSVWRELIESFSLCANLCAHLIKIGVCMQALSEHCRVLILVCGCPGVCQNTSRCFQGPVLSFWQLPAPQWSMVIF